jgi:3-carboxy-cis,cis-muconate cycloisomerase
MRRNLAQTGGLLMAESVTMAMAGRLGRAEAARVVAAASRRAAEAGRPLRDELAGDRVARELLDPDALERALDPLAYLGSAEAFVDRALARYAEDGT